MVGTHGNYMTYAERACVGKPNDVHADMILIDMNPKDPFDFFLDHYKDQMVSRVFQNYPGRMACGSIMPDFNQVRPAQKLGTKKP